MSDFLSVLRNHQAISFPVSRVEKILSSLVNSQVNHKTGGVRRPRLIQSNLERHCVTLGYGILVCCQLYFRITERRIVLNRNSEETFAFVDYVRIVVAVFIDRDKFYFYLSIFIAEAVG